MNPNDNQNPAPQDSPPQPAAPAGSDWQRQAMAGASVQSAQPTVTAAAVQPVTTQPIGPPQPMQPAAPTPPTPLAGVPVGDSPVPQPGQVFVSGDMTPNAPLPPSAAPGGSGKSKLPLILIIIVVLLGLAAGAYFMFFKGEKSTHQASEESKKTASVEAKDISTLKTVTFNAPDLSDFHIDKNQTNATYTTYLTKDENCSVAFGTVTATEVPGSTAEEAVDNQISALRREGAQIDGPTPGQALVLKDVAHPEVTYKIATLHFKMASEKFRVNTNYSIAILKNGDRAVVSVLCANKTGAAIPDSTLDPFVAKAKQLTINVNPAPSTAP